MTTHLRIPLAVLALLAAAAPALADSIDGHWCDSAGKREMAIEGSHMIMGSAKIDGAYSRHSFSYTAPDSDPARGIAGLHAAGEREHDPSHDGLRSHARDLASLRADELTTLTPAQQQANPALSDSFRHERRR